MAQLKNVYVRSRQEGKTWNIYSHKPAGRPAYVYACEGESEVNNGVRIFKAMLMNHRSHRVNIAGRCTQKAIYKAFVELLNQMSDAGYIFADDANELKSRHFVA
jgi:hypothetical protein